MLLRAFSNLELNRNDKAKEDFNEILKAGPDPECFYGLSKISNNFIESLEYLNKAIKHSNNDLKKSKYLKSRGKINQSLDNNDQAIEDFSLSYELNKNDFETLELLNLNSKHRSKKIVSKESSVSNSKKIYSKGGDYSSEIISIGKEIVESKNLEENIERLNLFLDEENFDKKLQPVCYDLIIQAHFFSKKYEDSIESINELLFYLEALNFKIVILEKNLNQTLPHSLG